jgi:tryptophan-rich sensory protein
MKNFLIKLFIFSLVMVAIDYCWIRFMPVEKQVPHVWLILVFFITMTAAFHFFAMQSSKGKPQNFVRYYMASTLLRFFLYIMIIVAYKFYDKASAMTFAIGFLGHYFLFTIFEVPVLLSELKKS